MTKRDTIAAMILQGLMSNSKVATTISNDEKITVAIKLADAFIAQLKSTAPKKIQKHAFTAASCGDTL